MINLKNLYLFKVYLFYYASLFSLDPIYYQFGFTGQLYIRR